jgi:hypothetical protein
MRLVGTNAESRIEPEVQTAPLQPTVPLDIKPTENGIEARPPQKLPQNEGQSFTPSQDASTCLPSASAVRQNHPGVWPSWTLRALVMRAPDAGTPQGEPRLTTIGEMRGDTLNNGELATALSG